MRAFLASQSPEIAAQVTAIYEKMDKPANKIDAQTVYKADDDDDLQEQVDQSLLELNFNGWTVIYDDVQPIVEEIAKYSSARALAQVGVTEKDITKLTDEKAVSWSRFRAAQLVGKKVDEDGNLIDNPDSEWSITESTRNYLRSTVTTAVKEGWSTDDLAGEIQANEAFSDSRADMIARTEIAFSDVQGRLIGYNNSGVVTGKQSILSDGHDDDDECDDNAQAGVIPIDEPFPSGDDGPPYHPRCECDIIPVVSDGEEEDDDD